MFHKPVNKSSQISERNPTAKCCHGSPTLYFILHTSSSWVEIRFIISVKRFLPPKLGPYLSKHEEHPQIESPK